MYLKIYPEEIKPLIVKDLKDRLDLDIKPEDIRFIYNPMMEDFDGVEITLK